MAGNLVYTNGKISITRLCKTVKDPSKKNGEDQESMQSSTILGLVHDMGK